MKVFVINKHGRPLMPTTPRKARILLKENKAKIVRRTPFTIQLICGSTGYTQPVKAGVDAGYENIGYSASTDKEELIRGEVRMMKGMSERLTERSKYRTQRRNRLRHRKPRFNNRCRPDGWLAPSIQHKLDTHIKIIEMLREVLPVTKLTVEVANFDIQKIKNPEINGKEYQQGEQLGFWNLRKYILHRDSHNCQNPNCKNKAKEKILEVHHIGYWKEDRTNRPGNLITLCDKCHTPKNHKKSGFLFGWEPKVKGFKPETFMSTVKKRLNKYADEITYGYITQDNRIKNGIEKSHSNDAFVISGGTSEKRCEDRVIVQIRRNKRSMEQFYDAKYIDLRDGSIKSGSELSSGRRTRNKKLNGENLRVYRGSKVQTIKRKKSKKGVETIKVTVKNGRRAIKTKKYKYSQGDYVIYEGDKFSIRGVHCNGTRVILHETGKSVKIDAVNAIGLRQGMCYEVHKQY